MKSVVDVIAEGGLTTLVTVIVALLTAPIPLAENDIVLLVKLDIANEAELYITVELLVIVTVDGNDNVMVVLFEIGENVIIHV